jgi:hypothetical protein
MKLLSIVGGVKVSVLKHSSDKSMRSEERLSPESLLIGQSVIVFFTRIAG